VTAPPLKVGTRGSRLALWQANSVAALLAKAGTPAEIVVIKTSGDRLQTAPLSEAGTKHLFVKEIDDALLHGEVDLAVHSAKDMPVDLPPGLTIAATLLREDPRDVLVLRADCPADDLPSVLSHLGERPVVATSSVRRRAQLTQLLPGATFTSIRGNVDTRLKHLDEGRHDALVLAAAGMRRLGLGDRISAALPIDVCVPAPGQGVIAIEARAGDEGIREVLRQLHDSPTGVALAAERALVLGLGGGCQLPLGGIAILEDGEIDMHGVVLSLDGRNVLRARRRGPSPDPEAVGRLLADDLAAVGALDILEGVRQSS
jgi:hydroxymethylbilane synthase